MSLHHVCDAKFSNGMKVFDVAENVIYYTGLYLFGFFLKRVSSKGQDVGEIASGKS